MRRPLTRAPRKVIDLHEEKLNKCKTRKCGQFQKEIRKANIQEKKKLRESLTVWKNELQDEVNLIEAIFLLKRILKK